MLHIKEGNKGSVVIDNRYGPLIVASFFGEIDLPLGQWYENRHGRVVLGHAREGRLAYSISDATRSTNPNAEMRRFWADLSDRHAELLQDKTLANAVVVSNPLMRGALTAVGWLSPRLAALQFFSNIDAAVAAGTAALAAAGISAPTPLGPYRLPAEADRLVVKVAKRA
jgi:hypothetical protein